MTDRANNNDCCSMCLRDFEDITEAVDKGTVLQLNCCEQYMHTECLEDFFNQSNYNNDDDIVCHCPLCRQILDYDKIISTMPSAAERPDWFNDADIYSSWVRPDIFSGPSSASEEDEEEGEAPPLRACTAR